MNKTVILMFFLLLICPFIALSQADLVIQSVAVDPQFPSPGDFIKISAIVTNPSDFDFKANYSIKILLDDVLIFEQNEPAGLLSKGTKIFQTELDPSDGDHTLKALLDPGDEMDMNPINNIEELKFSVLTEEDRVKINSANPIIDSADLPDLVCEELIRPGRGDLEAENEIIFYAVFRNYGIAPIPGPFNTAWIIDQKVLANMSIKNFPPNLRWKSGFKWKAKAGRHNLQAIIDNTNVIKEKIEDRNNVCDLTFTIFPKPILPTDINSDKQIKRVSFNHIGKTVIDNPIKIDRILIEPLSSVEYENQSLQKITYVVYNNSDITIENILVKVDSVGQFIHSFLIDRLDGKQQYEMTFIEKVDKGNVHFILEYDNKSYSEDGVFK